MRSLKVESLPDGRSFYVTNESDFLDAIGYAYYGEHQTELLLGANPHLSKLSLAIPLGTRIYLPIAPAKEPTGGQINLWD